MPRVEIAAELGVGELPVDGHLHDAQYDVLVLREVLRRLFRSRLGHENDDMMRSIHDLVHRRPSIVPNTFEGTVQPRRSLMRRKQPGDAWKVPNLRRCGMATTAPDVERDIREEREEGEEEEEDEETEDRDVWEEMEEVEEREEEEMRERDVWEEIGEREEGEEMGEENAWEEEGAMDVDDAVGSDEEPTTSETLSSSSELP